MARVPALPALLAETTLFRGQTDAVLAAVAAAMREARFAAGSTLFARGDPGDALHLVVEGRVRISIVTADGRELSFAHAVPHDVFGEIAVLDGSPRSADATAITDVVTFCLHRRDLDALLERHPGLARGAIELLCRRLREVSDHLEDIALLPLPARLARFFLNRVEGRPDGAAARVALGMSQGELALLLGASRPKVNAALMTLVQAGALTRDGDDFACDPQRLADLALREA